MCSILREKTYPERLLFEQGGLLLLLRLLLQLVVAHCHDGEDEVDEVEGAEENDKKKEDNMPRTGSPGELDRVDEDLDHDGEDGGDGGDGDVDDDDDDDGDGDGEKWDYGGKDGGQWKTIKREG